MLAVEVFLLVPGLAGLLSLVLFVAVYSSVFSMGILLINKLIEKGPEGRAVATDDGLPSRPLSAADAAAREAITGAQ